ncbi:iron donor protein CyaY [Chitiniphilus eburneus]|uniref:Iron-sulfur cluster assembly protein CyaY n=1 Tax=Chitiniphilus eburneus TaxID=2571148 RepID=A0A4U0Q3J8_9NEIS|nr:iron donor protein CyaY [Chitiniphilus eburneus]TJZ75663.1 iron donor protein CyaY [Chitiniphilus eburneus]
MTESEFLALTDAVFAQIEAALDAAGIDVDPLLAGNVLELEFDDGSKIIVNRHAANQELWIAARNGGFHYRLAGSEWRNTRGEGEFYADLAAAVRLHAAEDFSF